VIKVKWFKKYGKSGEGLDRVSSGISSKALHDVYYGYRTLKNDNLYRVSEYVGNKVGGWLDWVFDKIGLNTLLKYVIGDDSDWWQPEPPYVYARVPVEVRAR